MTHTYTIYVGQRDEPLPPALQDQLAEHGLTLVRRATMPELPLMYLLYLDDNQVLELARLGILRLSDLRTVPFAAVWRAMRNGRIVSIDGLYRVMTATGAVFKDIDPSKRNTDATLWIDRGLESRVTNALMREGVMSEDMLCALNEDDLTGIRSISRKTVRAVLLPLQDSLRKRKQDSGKPAPATADAEDAT